MPVPFARTRPVQPASARQVQPAQYGATQYGATQYGGAPVPAYSPAPGMGGAAGVNYESPNMPGYAWPSYAASPGVPTASRSQRISNSLANRSRILGTASS